MNWKIIGLVANLALVSSLVACSSTPTAGNQQPAPAPNAATTTQPNAMKHNDEPSGR